MTLTTEAPTRVAAPVKGMVFLHARRTSPWSGEPWRCTVTSVSKETVFWVPDYGDGTRFKTPLAKWETFCGSVVSTPAPVEKKTCPPISKAAAKALLRKADEAGMAAGAVATPTPMYVGSPTHPLGSDIDPRKPIYEVMDGVCGFAYINIPGDTPLGRRVREMGWRRAYYGGMERSVFAFGQSMTRKEAYAAAFTAVLREAGHRASWNSRMD